SGHRRLQRGAVLERGSLVPTDAAAGSLGRAGLVWAGDRATPAARFRRRGRLHEGGRPAPGLSRVQEVPASRPMAAGALLERLPARRFRRGSSVFLGIPHPRALVRSAMKLRRSWRLFGFGLAAAFVFACNLMNVLTPYRAPPEIVADRSEWIGIAPGSNRAFFRQIVNVPFTPRYAWIAVASDDYTLFVNDSPVAQNQFAVNAALSFQHRLSDRAQGVNPNVVPMARAPDLRLATNREWRARIHTDISQQIRQGLNDIALSLQTADPSVRVSLKGEIVGDGVSIPIEGGA